MYRRSWATRCSSGTRSPIGGYDPRHGLDFPEEWQMLDVVTRQVLRLSLAGLKRFQQSIPVSEFTRQSLVKHLGVDPGRITTIYSGIELDRFKRVEKPTSCSRESISSECMAWSTSAFICRYRNPPEKFNVLLEVVYRLRNQFADIKLIRVRVCGWRAIPENRPCR